MNGPGVPGCALAGAVLGAATGDGGSAVFGLLAGLVLGLVLLRLQQLQARLTELEREVQALRQTRAAAAVAVPTPTRAQAPPQEAASPPAPPRIELPPPPPIPPAPTAPPRPAATPAHSRAAPAPANPAQPVPAAAGTLRRWFSEGNVPVKIGMLILFAGIAALLNYLADQGWLRVPLQWRLAGIALVALAALAFGWRERVRRRSFGLGLQGGALGVLLLVTFAANRLYGLLPDGATLALVAALVVAAALLALLQDALALAVLGLLAGFAAPLLLATTASDHVILFGWYAALNLGVLGIALARSWRGLSLLGFLATYAIATGWGVLRYEPRLLASTAPFLALFFAIYLIIPILDARRSAGAPRGAVNGTLVFGNPLAAFALLAALLDGAGTPLALAALGVAGLYGLLARGLWSTQRLLGEAFAALAVGFATLAVPLAFEAVASAATFALEGAALVWLGLRQAHRLTRWSGLALQALAAGFAIAANPSAPTLPLLNGPCLSALLIAAAALFSAWRFARAGASFGLVLALHGWGLLWWLGAGVQEIDRFVPFALAPMAQLAGIGVSILLAAWAGRRTQLPLHAWTAALGFPLALLAILGLPASGLQPFAGWGLLAAAAWAAAGFASLRLLREAGGLPVGTARIGWIWSWTLLPAMALRQATLDAALGGGWQDAALGAPLLLAFAITLLHPTWLAPPGPRLAAQRSTLLGSQVLFGGLAFLLLLGRPGASAPLPWLPLLNPLELVQLGLLACAARWWADAAAPRELAGLRTPVLALGALAFLSAATLRAVHHLAVIPWDMDLLWRSSLAQSALSVVWSILGVSAWIGGSRRGSRPLWLAGAALMGLVLAKLLLVDRSHLGNLFGIGSFIAYGLLCTLIGYLAPAPPRAGDAAARAPSAAQ